MEKSENETKTITCSENIKAVNTKILNLNPIKENQDIENLINMINTTLGGGDTKEHLLKNLTKLQHAPTLLTKEDTTANAPTKTSTLSAFNINEKYDEIAAMSLQYDITLEKVLRGFKVTIGCEELIFHDQEYNHMVNVLCTYIINPEPLHNIINNVKRYGSLEDVVKSNCGASRMFHKSYKLITTKGRKRVLPIRRKPT